LVDIHGQSEHLSLLNRRYHLDFLDGYGGTLEKRQRFSDMVSRLGEAERELKSLIEAEKDFARKQEFLRFHLDEIKKARLRVGEQEELESERTRLAFSEKLKSLSSEVYGTMSGEESSRDSGSATGRLRESLGLMRKLVDIDPSLKPHLDYLSDASYGLEEVARAVRAYSESLEFDPRRLEEVESRLELLRNLERKYGPTVEQVLEYLQKSQVELDTLVHSSERRVELENGISRLRGEMAEIAAILSTARSKAAVRLAKEVKKELDDLQMSDVEFEVAVTQEESPGGLKLSDGRTCTFSAEGVDIVEFMVSTNPGEPLKPLVKIASTGEMSRFMLALKGALSRSDNTPVLIFDEIDIGVGGRSGEIVGRKLWLLARGRQVLCVTHLPQIAAFADAHCRIEKASDDSRTTSRLEVLENKERIEELAAMLSGARLTEASLKNAKDIAQKATKFKKAFTSGNTA
jgi:DNA repair protein RecN (Recombination protein N)